MKSLPTAVGGAVSGNAIEVERLRVRRGGRVVLHDLTFAVPAGTVTGLLGPSGCGKTTLMRSIVGVQIVEAGAVTVLDRPAGSTPLRRRVGYVTQAPSVYRDLTVTENLRYFADVIGVDRDRVPQTIDLVELADHADAVVNRLSSGQESRVSLAAALVGDPELLVLDEPTVGLDPVLRRDLWALFHRLADQGHTLLVSSHVMDEATRCDRLVLMREGRIVADATPTELRGRSGVEDLEEAFLRIVEEAAA